MGACHASRRFLAVHDDRGRLAERSTIEQRYRFPGTERGDDARGRKGARDTAAVAVRHAAHQLHHSGREVSQRAKQPGREPIQVQIEALERDTPEECADVVVEGASRPEGDEQYFVPCLRERARQGDRLSFCAPHAQDVLDECDLHLGPGWWARLAGSAGCVSIAGVKRRNPFVNTLLRWGINALGIFVAAEIIPGISFRDGKSLAIVVVVLGLFNAFLKPLLVLFALPFVILTLGVGILFINAFLLLLSAELVPGFQVDGFFAAFLGALVIGVINLLLGSVFGDAPVVMRHGGRRREVRGEPGAPRPPTARIHRPDRKNEDVIDI